MIHVGVFHVIKVHFIGLQYLYIVILVPYGSALSISSLIFYQPLSYRFIFLNTLDAEGILPFFSLLQNFYGGRHGSL